MPIAHPLFVPPTEEMRRGEDRLLARLSWLGRADGPPKTDPAVAPEPTAPTELAEGSGAAGSASGLARRDDDGRYEFGEVFASGGLGVVRRGLDTRLGRPVAIKELLRDSPSAARRFAFEAAITARLQHPGIVPLYDLGWYGPGKPFYCMKLVDGDSLEARIQACASLPERLRLLEHVIAVADAIAYAHEQQIIHRDIKPANVLVGRHGETVVIDWGLAKDLSGTVRGALERGAGDAEDEGEDEDAGAGLRSDMTEAGTIMGTLRYMAPEQARGDVVDARSDVYSLGGLLYHVLSGQPPLRDAQRHELVARVLAGSMTPLQTLDPAIPRGLAAIAARAQALDPAARYPSAAELAEDLRRFQAGRLVSAHEYSLGEVARLWLRRNRVSAGIGALALTVVSAVGVGALLQVRAQQRVAAAAEDAATEEAARAWRSEVERAATVEARRASEVLRMSHEPGQELAALAEGVLLVAEPGRELAAAPKAALDGITRALGGLLPVAQLDGERHHAFAVEFSPDGARMATISQDYEAEARAPRIEIWSTQPAARLTRVALDMSYVPHELKFSPDGGVLATSDWERCALFDAETGARLRELDACSEPEFSTDGSWLYGKAMRERDGEQRLYDALHAWRLTEPASATPSWRVEVPGDNFQLRVHPDGERLFVRRDHTPRAGKEAIELRSATTGELLDLLDRPPEDGHARRYWGRSRGAMYGGITISPDGRYLANIETIYQRGPVVLWDLETRAPTVLGEADLFSQQAFSGDSQYLHVGGLRVSTYALDRREKISESIDPGRVGTLGEGAIAVASSGRGWIQLPLGERHQAAPYGPYRVIRTSGPGGLIATLSDAHGELWRAGDHLATRRWRPPAGETIEALTDQQLLTKRGDGSWRVYPRDRVDAPPVTVELPEGARVVAHAASRPTLVALVSEAPELEVFDLVEGATRCVIALPDARDLPGRYPRGPAIRLSGDGGRLALQTREGAGSLWDVESCREIDTYEVVDPHAHPSVQARAAFAGDTLIALHNARTLLIDDALRRVTIDDPACPSWYQNSGYLRLSPAGVLATSCSSGQTNRGARLWDAATGAPLRSVDVSRYRSAPQFTADGAQMLFRARDREIAVVDVARGDELLRVPTAKIDWYRPSDDGRHVDVVDLRGALARYPTTRAGIVQAACRALAGSDRADETAAVCEALKR